MTQAGLGESQDTSHGYSDSHQDRGVSGDHEAYTAVGPANHLNGTGPKGPVPLYFDAFFGAGLFWPSSPSACEAAGRG